MFAQERIRIIKNFLLENNHVEVHALSSMLNVSEVTIRRDLEKLEKEGILTRTHGGAILKDTHPPLEEEASVVNNQHEAQEISVVAGNIIKNGDVIMLTAGTVNYHIAVRLRERSGITVLTNDISIAVEISSQTANKVVLLGGDLSLDGRSIYGALALSNLQRFHVNSLFAEVDGIGQSLDMTVASHEKAELIDAAMMSTDQKIIVCQASNFDKNAFCRLGNLTLADHVITNPTIPEIYKTKIFDNNIQLHMSINLLEGTV